jgi:Ca2+-binding EF-hand superfamily protein
MATDDSNALQRSNRAAASDDALSQIRQLQAKLRETERKLAEAEKLLQSRPAVSDSALHGKMIQKLRPWAEAATQIQSIWRGSLQRKRFFQMLDEYARRTGKIPKSQASDEQIMRQVQGAVKHRNLTMEQLYRAADTDSDGVLTCDELTQFINKLKLGLTPAQITRLMLILDEDYSGRIEQTEFYNALAAYRVATEHHRNSARTFEQEVLVKFVEVLEHRTIDPDEIFNLCDVNSDGSISTDELKVFVTGLNIGFQNKEVHALMKILDADSSGKVTREEYSKHINKGTAVFKIESAMAGTSAGAPQASSNRKTAFVEGPKLKEEVKAIIKKMDSTGLAIADAFERLEADRQGKLTIASFTRFLNKWYPNLSRDDVITLIANVDLDRNSLLDLAELANFISIYSTSSNKPNLKQTIRAMAVVVQRQSVSTSAFFSRHHVPSELNLNDFNSHVAQLFNLSREQTQQVFASLDLSRQNLVMLQDLVGVMNSYRTDTADEPDVMKSTFNEPTTSRVVLEISEVLAQNGLQPVHLYRFADKQTRNSIASSDLERAFQKLLPSLSPSLVTELLMLLPSDSIRKEDFLNLFEGKPQATKVPSENVLLKLVAAMDKMNLDPDMVFTTADKNRDDKATVAEMRAALRRCVPENVLAQADLNAIMLVLDISRSGVIDRDEFVEVLETARTKQSKPVPVKQPPTKAQEPVAKKAQEPAPKKTQEPPKKAEPKARIEAEVPNPAKVSEKSVAKSRKQMAEDAVFQKLASISRPGQLSGSILMEQSGLQLSAQLKLNDLERLFEGMTAAELSGVFKFLDPNNRGFVYLHSVATMIDLYVSGDLGQFPISQNPDAPDQAKELLRGLAKNLDDYNKNAFQFYTFMGIQPEQRLNESNFTFKLREEMSEAECRMVFPLCQVGGAVVGYHYISCIDSYCMPTIKKEGQWSKATQPFTDLNQLLMQIACTFPDDVPTKNLFAKTLLTEALDVRSFTALVKPVFRIDDSQCQYLFAQLDESNLGKLFAYQLYTFVDCYRSMVENGVLTYQHPTLPYKSVAEATLANVFKNLATKLDTAAQASSKAWQVDLEASLNEAQFYGLLIGLSAFEKQSLFTAIDILACRSVKFYHFLSVLDSYRKTFVVSGTQSSQATGRKEDAPASIKVTTDKGPAKGARTIKGLDRRLADFPEGSVEQGIFKLKLYAQSNLDSRGSLQSTFQKLDEDNSGALNEQEFTLALNRMKLGLTDKQKTELKRLADRNHDGSIQYEEFIDFIYEFDFSEQIGDDEALNSSNHNLLRKAMTMTGSLIHEIENYVIEPEKDFFRVYNPKWTTILNSEHAALKRCKELLENTTLFKDPDFGPEEKGGATALYWTGTPPGANFPPPSELSWRSPREWLGTVNFFSEDISSNDVIQGSLGDCWFIGALSVLAVRDELIRGSVESLTDPEQVTQQTILGISKGVYPPIFHAFAAKGLYVLRFFKNSAWRYVIVDERLPCFAQEGYEPSLVFGRNKDDRELWVAIIEKAFAKLHGCYEALGGGLIDDGLVDMTGFVAEKVKVNGKGGFLDGGPDDQVAKAEELWRKIFNFRKEGTLMGCSIDGQGVESDVVVNGEMTGLLARHAYSLIDVLEIKNPKATKGRNRLLRLRNPWGQREWQGKWSDKSAEMETFIDLIKREINRLEEEERFDPENSEDGSFLMCFKDWRSLYNNLYACVDFTDEWSGIRFKDAWTQATSGGVPTKPDQTMAVRWGKNPQFIVDLTVETDLFISLQQEDGRCVRSLPFPYEGFIKTACFSIMRLNKGENGIASFDSSRIVKLSVLKLHREVSLRISLPPGRFAIVPSTMNAGETGTFFLSIYFSCDKKKISMFKRGEAENKGDVIEEEEETSAEDVPQDVIEEMRNLISYLKSL